MYPLHRYRAVAPLTADEEQALLTLGDAEQAFSARETIRSQGDAVSGFYLHNRGWVASSIMLPDGARLIQKIHLPGDMLGTPSMVLSHAADTLTAITAATVAFVPFVRLGAIYERLPRLAALFTIAVQAERLSLMDTLAVTGRATAAQQLARLLLDLYARLMPLGMVEDDAFDLPLSQEAIGDLTGLTAVHVNRKLREMRESGLIGRDGSRMKILDVARLRGLSPVAPRRLQHEPAWLPSVSLTPAELRREEGGG